MVGAPLEEGIPTGGPSNVDETGEGSPSRVISALILLSRPVDTVFSRRRPLNQVLLSTYVSPHERIHHQAGIVAPNLQGAMEIIHHWSPFNQAKPLVAHMHNLYPNYFRVPVVARAEQYSIPFPVYRNKEAFQLVGEDGMLIHNHDFHQLAELVRTAC